MTVLDVKDLSVDFATEAGTLQALRKVSLEVPTNRIVGVVGESGCGKSTLINAILGLLADNGRVTSGQILFEGKSDLVRLDDTGMRALRGQKIATVFQDPMGALNPVLSVGKQMRDIQYRSGLSRKAKDALSIAMLRKVRIPDPERRLAQFPHEFSGGMKQRIAIAMALLMQPSLLIADEPTTALDATLEVAIIELLKDLQKQIGCSVLFISHHLGVIAELCDEMIVMYAGEVVERGSTRDIFHNPRHPYTKKLLACDPARLSRREPRLPTIPGTLPDLRNRPKGCVFQARCELADDVCSAMPPDTALSASHIARCWHTDETAGAAA
ncbi:ABC transporter ATP-binding protein [Mesorhizobium sp. B3-1-3]|uniref:ABC transporter ATP-binding protein n=1 Tax=unclassified Mesorhizobium TaxID=325217 RepID=UPI00112CAA2C|nr:MULTISPECIES: ABC transporter ATP-binding protein [unclassified Mesorhizobium]TPI63735.1 ABC transporter ATP-binding protein [Mesorhizobium sp. B3-1-3]TPI65625.1 ABC transporter ATP-binding protein [Mesorhizobium sp. B3-1-8]